LIQKKLDDGHEIRPFPTAVNHLLAAIKNPKSDAKTFADIVKLDAALSTRVLRMVNSPLYGFSNEVQTLRQAVALLGQRPLRNLALTYAGASIISGKHDTKEHSEALWNHSLGCATVAGILADSVTSVSSDDAFLAGIFHDIGKLFFLDFMPTEYSKLISSTSGAALLDEEAELFGMTHQEVGLRLTVTWPLPDEIKGSIRYHHEPEADASKKELSAIIHVADGLSRSAGIGSIADQEICVAKTADEYFGLSEDALDSITANSRRTLEETMQAFSIG